MYYENARFVFSFYFYLGSDALGGICLKVSFCCVPQSGQASRQRVRRGNSPKFELYIYSSRGLLLATLGVGYGDVMVAVFGLCLSYLVYFCRGVVWWFVLPEFYCLFAVCHLHDDDRVFPRRVGRRLGPLVCCGKKCALVHMMGSGLLGLVLVCGFGGCCSCSCWDGLSCACFFYVAHLGFLGLCLLPFVVH